MLSVPTKAFISKVFSNHDFLSGTPFGTPLFEVYHHILEEWVSLRSNRATKLEYHQQATDGSNDPTNPLDTSTNRQSKDWSSNCKSWWTNRAVSVIHFNLATKNNSKQSHNTLKNKTNTRNGSSMDFNPIFRTFQITLTKQFKSEYVYRIDISQQRVDKIDFFRHVIATCD